MCSSTGRALTLLKHPCVWPCFSRLPGFVLLVVVEQPLRILPLLGIVLGTRVGLDLGLGGGGLSRGGLGLDLLLDWRGDLSGPIAGACDLAASGAADDAQCALAPSGQQAAH